MNTIITKHINDVIENDVLATDIYFNEQLIISKDTLLTPRLISLLKKRNIRQVCTTVTEQQDTYISEEEVEKLRGNQLIKINKLFFESLEHVGSESRYGNILSTSEDMEFIMNLFLEIHDKYNFIDELYKLKDWDRYTYIHSFDVFVLGSLFARQKGVRDLESVALGYLLHDIGKLHIPQELLALERKFGFKEFDLMKTHTTIGYTMLNSMGLNHIAEFAKSHHERVDGSGYPDQLRGHEIKLELKILQIVDVYSALMLDRPYREALSASKAVDILYRNAHQFDRALLEEFIELLKIYPNNSTVLLSDNTYAQVERVNRSLPMFPVVKRTNDRVDFHLPYDFKIKIEKMIEYRPKSFQDRFKEFTHNVITGSESLLSDGFSDLTDGLKIEEIYGQIIIPVHRVLTILHEGNVIDFEEYTLRNSSIMRLLQLVEDRILKNNHYKVQTLLVIEGKRMPIIHIKVLQGLLHIENIYPMVIENPGSPNIIQKVVDDFGIESAFIFTVSGNPILHNPSHTPEVSFRSIAFKELTKAIDSITSLSNPSNLIYDWLNRNEVALSNKS